MNISMQLTVVVVAVCLCLAEGAPDGRLGRKQQRPTRGFKNVEMMTARGFGKRDSRPYDRPERDVRRSETDTDKTVSSRSTPKFKLPSSIMGRDFGKRTPEKDNEELNYEAPSRRRFNPKNNLMVAYDFGKRSVHDDTNEEEEIRVTRGTFRPSKVFIARGYGKRVPEKDGVMVDSDDILAALIDYERSKPDEGLEMPNQDSMPLDLLVLEMMKNPAFTRSVVRKFIDVNQDGKLSLNELLRNEA